MFNNSGGEREEIIPLTTPQTERSRNFVSFAQDILRISCPVCLLSLIQASLERLFSQTFRLLSELLSGDGEIRTLDPLLARQVLSQLSYTPI